jgi:hypothetical protein
MTPRGREPPNDEEQIASVVRPTAMVAGSGERCSTRRVRGFTTTTSEALAEPVLTTVRSLSGRSQVRALAQPRR